MNIKSNEKKENSTYELVIEVGAAEFQAAIDKVYARQKNRINVPGFRTAAFIAENPLLKDAVHQVVVDNKAFGENLCGTIAFCTAYESCDYYADQLTAYLDENRKMLARGLEQVPEIRMISSEGTYFAWLDCRALGMTQDELDQFFVNRVKLGLNSGRSFGPDGTGFLRLNFACPRAVAEEALSRIVTQLTALR